MTWGDNNARVNLRLPADVRRTLMRLAKQARGGHGLLLSEYIRELLIEHAEASKKREKKGGR